MVNQENTMVGKSNMRTKIIKRYQNRKLYDTQQSCYVTLDDIAKMIRANEDVMVIDNKSKNDITAATLTQIIFESEKKTAQYAPLFTLREIIQYGSGSISNYLAKLGAFPADYAEKQAAHAREAALEASLKSPTPSYDDIKQSLDERVISAAASKAASTATLPGTPEVTPNLPSSNRSLDN
ncbi:MAG: regulator for granula-associated protein [Bdellovibrionales bacterium RBG_16_40_8]|nr:MAG: regulator for granula-associated protein [Bdellovibrionales bacterium RBG_16_40_8]